VDGPRHRERAAPTRGSRPGLPAGRGNPDQKGDELLDIFPRQLVGSSFHPEVVGEDVDPETPEEADHEGLHRLIRVSELQPEPQARLRASRVETREPPGLEDGRVVAAGCDEVWARCTTRRAATEDLSERAG
jgi:hypothetical protein